MILMRIIIFLVCVCCLACKADKEVELEKSSQIDNEKNSEIIGVDTITEYIGHQLESESTFDRAKWMIKDDHHYPFRDSLLTGLLNNHTLDSLTKAEVIDLLGSPTRTDNNYLFYRISQKRLGLWPLHTKTLVIKFVDDNSIEWIRIHE